jgi:hypothetical protein
VRREPLTASQRAFIWAWHRFTKTFVGFSDPFAAEHVRMEGVRGFLRWVRVSFELFDQLDKRFGAVEAQLVIAFAAMWTGCRWCSIGHVLSANLELLKREGELGPLDERSIPDLRMMQDGEVLELLQQRFSGPRWEKLNGLIERQYLLRTGGAEEESRDDELLQATNVLWEWVVECSITAMDVDPSKIPPQTPIGKDRALLERYYEARKQKGLDQG